MSNWTPGPSSADDLEGFERSAAVALFIDVEDRLFPRQPTLLERNGLRLKLLGAAALGCFAATSSMFATYIVLTLLFHFQPA